MKQKRLAIMLIITSLICLTIQGCATAKGALAGAAIGGLVGNAGRGAQIGATAGLLVDIFR